MAKNIRVFLKTTQTMLIPADESGEFDAEVNTYTSEFESVGVIYRKDGLYTIVYEENGQTGLGGVITTINFKAASEKEITVLRNGDGCSTLIFKPGERYISAYDTQYGSFEMAVVTNNVENTVNLSGGMLKIDYMIEFHGVSAEKTTLEITVKCEASDN